MTKEEVKQFKAQLKAMLFFLALGIILGICLTQLYINLEKQKEAGKLEGLFFNGNYTKLSASEFAYNYNEGEGDWVCSNVKGLTYSRCVEVAQHECGHELFSEVCEKDTSLCKATQELLNNYSN